MRHHAYFIAGDIEKGIDAALAFGRKELGLTPGNPDLIVLRHGLLSAEDALALSDAASTTALSGNGKLIIASATRLFHEAQNKLLKIFEEPPEGTTLVLVIPSEGMLIPTLRSRLIELPAGKDEVSPLATEFLAAKSAVREKLIAKLLDRAKSDKPDEKQAARADILSFIEGLSRAGYTARLNGDESKELVAFLDDLSRFMPILHERSAPLKPILEHVLITAPGMVKK